jgi:two-component system alkaline phosphatase synthesis response regulator PhoP
VPGGADSPQAICIGEVVIDTGAHRVRIGHQPVDLTPTEFALLRVLAENPGRALTRPELIDRTLGYRYEGKERTVDSLVKNLRRKLDEACGAAQLIETVFGVGYRLSVGDS